MEPMRLRGASAAAFTQDAQPVPLEDLNERKRLLSVSLNQAAFADGDSAMPATVLN
jgi:hypothetical protein